MPRRAILLVCRTLCSAFPMLPLIPLDIALRTSSPPPAFCLRRNLYLLLTLPEKCPQTTHLLLL